MNWPMLRTWQRLGAAVVVAAVLYLLSQLFVAQLHDHDLRLVVSLFTGMGAGAAGVATWIFTE